MRRLGLVLAVLTLGVAFAASPTIQQLRWAFKGGISVGAAADDTAANRITNRLGGASTIDFASTSSGIVFSSAITKTGAAVGDICTVSAPAAASALKAKFACVVTATNEVKVQFIPEDKASGVATFDGGSPAQIDVLGISAGSYCTCAAVGATAAIAGTACAVSLTSTTLTITGPNSANTTVNYSCVAPVDPASGSYNYELTRNGS